MNKAEELTITVNELSEFPVKQWFHLLPNRKGNPGTKNRKKYYKEFITFDIETSKIEDIEQSFMYIWQCCIAGHVNIIGRTWEEFKVFIDYMLGSLPETVVCYVHNLSYEFSFLKGVLQFGENDVFAAEPRSVIKAVYNNIEFRCSYFLTNVSLDKFTSDMDVAHKKLSGDKFNYNKVRAPNTKLSADEIAYCLNDVMGLWEAIETKMESTKDTIASIPLTSTGYVRRDIKKAMHMCRNQVQDIFPDFTIYKLLRRAFRGGDTHASRYYSGIILPDVHSYDRVSSYPDVLVNCRFPISPFLPENPTMERLIDLIEIHNKAVLFTVAICGLVCKDETGCPYIPFDKCTAVGHPVRDNGRILSANYLEITITDIDWRIIQKEYTWDSIEIIELYSARYGNLPRPIIDCILKYYKGKTTLKGDEERALDYQLYKGLLNSIYGLMAQNPVKFSYIYDEVNRVMIDKPDEFPEDLLSKSHNSAFVAYQWGVWCTAWARYRLHEMIWLVGDAFVYCDTDSVKAIGNFDNIVQGYNKQRLIDSKQTGAVAASRNGDRHYMGIYELDGVYTRFCTLGAKKYCYEDTKGLHITISGVKKKEGAQELEKIENFTPDFCFKRSAGLKAKYNDNVDMWYEYNGEPIHISDNVYLSDTEYTLGITDEYKRILQFSQQCYHSPIDRELR